MLYLYLWKAEIFGNLVAPRVKEIVPGLEIAYTFRMLSIYDHVQFGGLYLYSLPSERRNFQKEKVIFIDAKLFYV